MGRPRTFAISRRLRPACAALLLTLLAGACVPPSVAPPSPEGQPAAPAEQAREAPPVRVAPEEDQQLREDDDTYAAFPADDPDAAPEEPTSKAPATPEVRTDAGVGLLLPLSGRYAAEGETLLRAAQLALFDTADEHFTLLPRDTGGTASGATQATQALLAEGVDLILGPLFAEGVKAVAVHARAAGVPVIAFSTDRSAASEGVYLLGHTPRAQIRRVFAHAAAQGHREVALLAPETRYGTAVADEASAAAALTELSLTRVRTYGADGSDAANVVRALAEYDRRAQALQGERLALAKQNDAAARRQLERLKTLDTLGKLPFDAVLLADGGSRLRQVAALLPFYDIDPEKIRFLGIGLWEEPETLGERALAGGWFAGPDPAARRSFEARYTRIFGEPPGAIATLAYDATALAAALARAGASFGPGAIGNRGGFLGADGLFRFDSDGFAERGLAVFEVTGGGETLVVSPAPARFDTETDGTSDG